MIKQFHLTRSREPSRYTDSKCGPGSNGNEGVLNIPQSCRTGTSPSNRFNVISKTLGVYVWVGTSQ